MTLIIINFYTDLAKLTRSFLKMEPLLIVGIACTNLMHFWNICYKVHIVILSTKCIVKVHFLKTTPIAPLTSKTCFTNQLLHYINNKLDVLLFLATYLFLNDHTFILDTHITETASVTHT